MTLGIWETIVYVASVVAIVGSIAIVITAGRWIVKTYFPKKEQSGS